MIFFHNPYDDLNTITRAPEVFFHETPSVQNVWFTVPISLLVDTSLVKEIICSTLRGSCMPTSFWCNRSGSRRSFRGLVILLGSCWSLVPSKTDAIVAMLDGGYEVPNAWKEKVRGRKVFLLNTHLYYFHKTGARGMREHTEIVETFLERDDCSLIWRPHPLLHTLLSKTSHEFTVFYRNMCKLLASSGNCLVDTTTDYRLAFSCSNAMISTYSSLVNEYMVTGKPVLIFQRKPDSTTAQHFPLITQATTIAMDQPRRIKSS